MRFATFNVSSGRSLGSTGPFDPTRFGDAIAALDADVVALQEVDRDQPRSGHVDLARAAAAALGAEHWVFAPTLYGTPGRRWGAAGDEPRDGPAYGCALISRLPLRDVAVLRIPAAPLVLPLYVPDAGVILVREEPRVAIVAVVAAGARGDVTVVSTHLPFVPGWKQWRLRRLVRDLQHRPDPLLLLGDLNLRGPAAARVTGYRRLTDSPTFPAPSPRVQFDHVLLRGEPGELGPILATSTPVLDVSDHRPVIVDVDRG